MTQEEKQLLLKDLCARLPYGVKILHRDSIEEITEITPTGEFKNRRYDAWFDIDNCRPYLRPLSSMTEEEKEEFNKIHKVIAVALNTPHKENEVTLELAAISVFECDFYCSHHFDYRGLIEKGLALEALEGMYD